MKKIKAFGVFKKNGELVLTTKYKADAEESAEFGESVQPVTIIVGEDK